MVGKKIIKDLEMWTGHNEKKRRGEEEEFSLIQLDGDKIT